MNYPLTHGTPDNIFTSHERRTGTTMCQAPWGRRAINSIDVQIHNLIISERRQRAGRAFNSEPEDEGKLLSYYSFIMYQRETSHAGFRVTLHSHPGKCKCRNQTTGNVAQLVKQGALWQKDVRLYRAGVASGRSSQIKTCPKLNM